MKSKSSYDFVGLMADRGPNLLVGLVAILKAGSAIVPIDPKHPLERMDFIVKDCGIEVLITEEKYLEKATQLSDANCLLKHIVCIDGINQKLGQTASARLDDLEDHVTSVQPDATRAVSDDLLYVTYTSGSTGNPKGVPISNSNLVPLLLWSKEYFGLGEHTKVLQNLSHCFDFGIFELLTTLLFGGTLCFPDEAELDKASGYRDYINKHAINTIHTTPSAYQAFISGAGRLETVDTLHLGGEQLTLGVVDEIFEGVGESCVVYNGYGPTEASINSSIFRVGTKTTKKLAGSSNVPIGKASAKNTLFVLDGDCQLVPIGVPGELHIGGVGLTEGYLNRPDLTSEKFIPDPFGSQPGARLYKTGDLVRYLPDYNIEFLGRIDQQVKIRGFRIEPGEIETALAALPHVKHAVVTSQRHPDGNRLVAYVVPAADGAVTNGELRGLLRQKLPEYMVPTIFVTLEALPLTQNGKVNFRALPAPDDAGADWSDASSSPSTPTEEIVAGICAQVLGRQAVGVHDNLFDLGCHSLLATRIVARLIDALRVELPLRRLFESPTVAELAKHVDSMLQTGSGVEIPPIRRAARDQDIPLSFQQERLWFLSQLDPDNLSYNIPRAIRIGGALRIDLLELSFAEIIRRHEILRTTFPTVEGRPVQVIQPCEAITIPIIDLSTLEPAVREAEVRELIVKEGQQKFDLASGPLLRLHLLRVGEDEHILVLCEHHVVHDGWTQGVLLADFLALYKAFSEGNPSPLPELPIQYADFALWQREWLKGDVLERQLSYWEDQMAGAPALLDLGIGKRPAVQTFAGTAMFIDMPQSLSKELRALSHREGATLFMVMLAALKLLLHRYSGQNDLCIGTGIANRRTRQLEGMLGMFINTIVLRTDLSGNPTFRELLGRIRNVCLGAYANQDLPFEKLVEELHPERSLGHMPLFQIMFSFLDTPMQDPKVPGLDINIMRVHNGTAKFDLDVLAIPHRDQRIGQEITDDDPGITMMYEYSTDIFDPEAIARMHEHYMSLLEDIIANPEQRISSFRILTQAEQRRLLFEWNSTEKDLPEESCIHHLIEAQAELTPEAAAIEYKGRQLTYLELNQRANQLAHYLIRRGVGPDTAVAICLDRSLEMFVGILGILKAGGAYVPLDPAYPKERLSRMLEDSRARLILTQRHLIERNEGQRDRLLCLDTEWDCVANEEACNPGRRANGDNLVYIIYTSGSTGKPKGVMTQHRNLVHYIRDLITRFRIKSGDRYLQFASISFDMSAEDIYGALASGATLVVRDDTMLNSASFFLEQCRKLGITLLSLPTAYWHELAESLSSGVDFPESLRLLLFGGEKAQTERLAAWQQHISDGFELFNTYGPTETTVVVTCYQIPKEPESAGLMREVPIGFPISNSKVYVLDSYLNPVPIGVQGELYVGGAGLARGYLDAPELTAEKFIPDPFDGKGGGRLYRTQDIVRYRVDGALEFVGRIDRQVKIRSFRIELGEIESSLLEHPALSDAVVLCREDVPGDKRLVAYVVPNQQPAPTTSQLRSFVKERLPDHMIPSSFIALDRFPRTNIGKLNWNALPAPTTDRPELDAGCVVPRTTAMEVLAGIWEEQLGIDKIGIHDNFFELGGHSLLAARIITRIREIMHVELALRELFEAATIAELAGRIDRALPGRQGLEMKAVVPVGRDHELALSFGQRRLWFLDQLDPGNAAYNLPSAALLEGRLDVGILARSVSEIVRRHETLRTIFVTSNGGPVQVIQPASGIGIPVVDLRGLSERDRRREAGRLAEEEARRPFDLARGPLFRVTLLQMDELEHIAVENMHHIVSDGWSMEILIGELSALYKAYAEGEGSPLGELPVQYGDFAERQKEWFEGEGMKGQLEYWRKQLGRNVGALKIPTDRPAGRIQSYEGARQTKLLTKSLSERIKEFSRREGATLFMTMLAGFKLMLHRYTGQGDIAIGTPFANRNRLEVEGMIGFFVNTLVLRTDLTGNPSFVELVKRVREVTLEAYANQDVPFEKLVDELQPERDLSRQPLFQVMFMIRVPTAEIEIPELKMSYLEIENRTAKFDLTLSCAETEDGLQATMEYRRDLFDESTIGRMLGHLEVLLEGAISNPEMRISEYSVMSAAEEHRILVEWNERRTEYEEEGYVHRLFEEQAERSPDEVAVVSGRGKLTYGELNEEANKLAHYLISLGVGVETRVGICMRRSPELMVGLMAIVKAGGAYVPLDAAYPRERLEIMLEDSEAALVITEQGQVEGMSAPGRKVVCVDSERDREQISRQETSNPVVRIWPENLAYVIYTSGSTGRPKGVAIEHRNCAAFLSWAREEYTAAEHEGALASTSICFDLSVFEIFGTLSRGGKVILAENALDQWWVGEEVTLINTVPSAIAEMVRTGTIPRTVRTVNLAGEALHNRVAQEVYEQSGVERVMNLYGPTEDTTYSTYTKVKKGGTREPTIGRPITNTSAYVVDEQQRPCPIGVIGELQIGGEGLARGYLSRPGLTAEKFVPNPFSADGGARLYKTGDLARYLADGEIEFLGRSDHQVKIRGFRIELGEIETVLTKYSGVREAAVLNWSESDQKLLAAFVVPEDASKVTAEQLRNYLREKLPDHMVPSIFVMLDAFPLTPNGKTDRLALMVPDRRQLQRDTFVPPRTQIEKSLAEIWTEVLGLSRVGVDDNFFDLGGDSILSVQVIARSNETGLKLTPKDIFLHQTIAELAMAAAPLTCEGHDIEASRYGGSEFSTAELSQKELDEVMAELSQEIESQA